MKLLPYYQGGYHSNVLVRCETATGALDTIILSKALACLTTHTLRSTDRNFAATSFVGDRMRVLLIWGLNHTCSTALPHLLG